MEARRAAAAWLVGAAALAAGPARAQEVAYYGGHVVSRAEVVVVLWGDAPAAAKSTIGPFLQDFLASAYLDWLGEYDTAGARAVDGAPGSSQHVQRGRYAGTVTIAPRATSGGGAAVSDAQIASELVAQIAAGALPAPALDAEGGADTVFVVLFPRGVEVDDATGGASCNAGVGHSFCGYHASFAATAGGRAVNVPYVVVPDVTAPACATACGQGDDPATYTVAVSHELVEAITDPELGAAPAGGAAPARPAAWIDAKNGEIADVCAHTTDAVGTVGAWKVQRAWSRRLGACIASDPALPACGATRPCAPCATCAQARGGCRASAGDAGGPGALPALGALAALGVIRNWSRRRRSRC